MSRLEIPGPDKGQLVVEELYKIWNVELNPALRDYVRLT